MKIIKLLIIFILPVNVYAAEFSCKFSGEWKRLLINTDTSIVKIQYYSHLSKSYENKVVLQDVDFDSNINQSFIAYTDESRSKIAVQVKKLDDGILEFETIKYSRGSNKFTASSCSTDFDQFLMSMK